MPERQRSAGNLATARQVSKRWSFEGRYRFVIDAPMLMLMLMLETQYAVAERPGLNPAARSDGD